MTINDLAHLSSNDSSMAFASKNGQTTATDSDFSQGFLSSYEKQTENLKENPKSEIQKPLLGKISLNEGKETKKVFQEKLKKQESQNADFAQSSKKDRASKKKTTPKLASGDVKPQENIHESQEKSSNAKDFAVSLSFGALKQEPSLQDILEESLQQNEPKSGTKQEFKEGFLTLHRGIFRESDAKKVSEGKSKDTKESDKDELFSVASSSKGSQKDGKNLVQVIDLRSSNEKLSALAPKRENAKTHAFDKQNSGETSVSLDVRPQNPPTNNSISSSDVALFEKYMAKTQAQDFVKNIQFVLQKEGEGSITFLLKPESLGEVKIELLMQNKEIKGQIFVENAGVKYIFEQHLEQLNKALQSSGYEASTLNVLVDPRSGGRQGNRGDSQSEAKPFFSEKFTRFDTSFSSSRDFSEGNYGVVDLVV